MDDTIIIFHRILRFTGISIFKKEKWNARKWFLLQFLNVICGLFCIIFSTGFLIENIADIVALIQGACVWSTTVIMNASIVICFIYRTQFHLFLEEVIFKDCALEIPLIEKIICNEPKSIKLKQLKNIVLESQERLCRFSRVLLISYLIICLVCITLFVCGPIYSMLLRKEKSFRPLAFVVWFPLSMENVGVYVAMYIYQMYCGYLCSIMFPGFLSILTLLIGQVIRQLKILKFILLNLDYLVEELVSERGKRWQEQCTLVLINCVQHFVKIKSFSNRLNVLCKPFYLTMILDTTMQICVCSVKISISEKLGPDILKYYFQELVFVLLNLVFCFLGQKVKNECEELEKAVTEKWYIYDRKHKISVQIFKTALSQGMPIYVFGSVTLSFTTFTWFVKTGLSFYTVMTSILES